MKKNLIIFYSFVINCLLYIHTVSAGEIIVWEDSAPFPKTIVEAGVQKDSLITLEPVFGLNGNDIDLENFTLGGFDWEWPYNSIELGGVEDIDIRTLDDQDLYLITDPLRPVVPGVSGKLFIYNPLEKRITWEYTGSELVLPVDAFEFFENGQYRILVADRGNHKVMQIGRETQSIDWEYGDPNGLEGSGPNQLSNPADAVKIDGASQVLIADRGNNRVIIVDKASKTVVWELGPDVLSNPVDVEYIKTSNNILVTDQGHNRVIIVSRQDSSIIWQYPDPADAGNPEYGLNNPVDADILVNGHVLIADAGNNRVIEVDPNDSEYFWELKLSLYTLRDVDQIGADSKDRDKLMVVHRNEQANKILPSRIGFQSGWRESQIYVLAQDVNFDTLFWDADTNHSQLTSLELQFRTGADENSIKRAPWLGPDGDTLSTYKKSGQKFADAHNGFRIYQFRAYLKTESPKDTPVLKKVSVKYHYYKINGTPKPYFWASSIGIAESDSMIPKWKEFSCKLKLPDDPLKRGDIQLLFRIIENKSPYRTLHEFSANTNESENILNLENIPALWEATSINLNAFPSTQNSSVTPALISWKVVYEKIMSTVSSLRFVDEEGNNVYSYLATAGEPAAGEVMDKIYIILDDNNLELTRQYVELPVKSLISRDEETINLRFKQNYFQNDTGLPIVIRNYSVPGNDTLEVVDRDTMIVYYQDANDSTDISADSVLVVQATRGEMTIENAKGQPLSEVYFGDQLFIRVTGEQDKNLNPAKQDSLKIVLKNTALDREDVYLYEIPNSKGVYNSDNFINKTGIPVMDNKNGITLNDGIMQSSYGGSIQAEYVDNVTLTKSVLVPSEQSVYIDLGGEPYIVEVAPNPYNENTAANFRMRIASATGSLVVRKLEIFNIAGERVREIDGGLLNFDTGTLVPKERYGIADNWWDLYNDSGQKVSSGTYWLKVHVNLQLDNPNETKQISIFRKFMIIR
ncbi:hypothetical protein JXQ31_09310 [candidate division KSB1 bacterium]|nr:hypothetical protein [candidate division KSB1 bacterium]